MARVVLRDGRVVETNDEIIDDAAALERSQWIAYLHTHLHSLDSLRSSPYPSDDLREWRKADRAAWAEYRKWEDKMFPIDHAKLFKDAPGMVAARRAFEREQEISKAKEILRLREASCA